MKKFLLTGFILIVFLSGCVRYSDGEPVENEKPNQEENSTKVTETSDANDEENKDEETKYAEQEISTNVEMKSDAKINGNSIVIEGKTNLPNDTLIAYEVTHEEDFEYFTDGVMKVEDGTYAEEVDINEWPNGEIKVWTSFQTILGTSTEQPKEIIEVFGEAGENIKGDNVTEGDIINSVESVEILNK